MKSILASALVLALVGTAGVASAETIKYSSKGAYANASWGTWDECTSEYLHVSGSESATRETGTSPTSGSYLYVSYDKYDWCTGEFQWFFGESKGQVIAGQKVTLKGSVTGFSYPAESEATAIVDLTLTSNGEYSSKGTTNYVTTSGGVRTRFRSVGSSESANVSGTVTIDGVNVSNGSPWAEIGRSSNANMLIIKADAQ